MSTVSTTSASTGAAGIKLLAEVFSSQVRAEVLAYIVPRDGAAFSLTELSRTLGLAVSSVQHECYKLERLRILVGKREGSSRRYRLSPDHRLAEPLRRLVLTALGPEASFHAALGDVDQLSGAILASPDPAGAMGADLVLIGDPGLEALAIIQHRIATILAIDDDNVAVAFFSAARWQEHRAAGHPLVKRLQTLTILATWGDIE